MCAPVSATAAQPAGELAATWRGSGLSRPRTGGECGPERRGAESCYWDYTPSFGRGPFRNVICLAVNDAVLHGLPHDYTLRDGDVLTADLAVGIDGWVADSAPTVVVGTAAEEDLRIIRATEEALEAAIEMARPGNRLGDISATIGVVAHAYGYPVNDEFGGHGLGRTMHEDPHVLNTGRAGRGLKLRPGLTLALEPWFARTTGRIVYDADGWTIRSADGSRTAIPSTRPLRAHGRRHRGCPVGAHPA